MAFPYAPPDVRRRAAIQWDSFHKGGKATDRKCCELSDFSASAKMEEDSSRWTVLLFGFIVVRTDEKRDRGGLRLKVE